MCIRYKVLIQWEINRGISFNKIQDISPYWITGFSDGDSSFTIRIVKDKTRKQPWRVKPIFSIELHNRDKYILNNILYKNFLR